MQEFDKPITPEEREMARINLAKISGINPIPATAVELLGQLPRFVTKTRYPVGLPSRKHLPSDEARELLAGNLLVNFARSLISPN